MKKQPREKRYRYVSHHAVERLRERIIALDMQHRLDADLEQWLDDAVEQAVRRGDVQVVTDNKQAAKLANIEPTFGAPAFALLKPNDHPRAKLPEAVITVLDDVMVAKYQQNRWKDDKHRPFTVLAGMKVPESKPMEPTVEHKRLPRPIGDSQEQMLVSYVGENGVTYQAVPRAQLKHQLIQLALDPEVDQETIRAWREVKVDIKVSVDVGL